MSSSLDFRRDVRSTEQFQKDVKDATFRERLLVNDWIDEMAKRGFKVTAEDNGIDNSGELVEQSDCRPDYKVTCGKKSALFEVKQNVYSHKQTFKVYDLQQYIKMGAKILLFYGIGTNAEITSDSRWAIIKPEAMQRMLAELPHEDGGAKWGNKTVVILYKEKYPDYFQSESFRIYGKST